METDIILSHEETLFIDQALGKDDGVIAFPTDTVYGMGCVIGNEASANKIYDIKGRDKQKPLTLLGVDFDSLERYVKYVPEKAEELIKHYWPGGLTIILPKSRYVPDYITSGLDTVGIRVPNHPVFLEVLKRCVQDKVLATTSANFSYQSEMITYDQVKEVLFDKIDYIIPEHGIISKGIASTVISITKDNKIKVLREGEIKF